MRTKIIPMPITSSTNAENCSAQEPSLGLKNADRFQGVPAVRRFSVMSQRRWRNMELERSFVARPTVEGYMTLARSFNKGFLDLGKNSFDGFAEILIVPKKHAPASVKKKRELKLEKWHEKKSVKHEKASQKAAKKSFKREEKIHDKGKGIGGITTVAVYDGKRFGRGIKDYATVRGYMFHATNALCGSSLDELLPRYGARNTGYIGVRISEFAINTAFLAVGYGLSPVSDGISIYVSDHLRTLTTIGGEAIALGILGARPRKIITHSTLRATQLGAMKAIPVAGNFLQYAEAGAQASGNAAIALSHIADIIMRITSDRHVSLLTPRDLGDSSVLYELEVRIDYLSRFLIPYGQWLLFQESDLETRGELKKILRKQSKILTKLEKKRENAIGFYQIALLGDRVPKDLMPKIMVDTLHAASSPRKNCLRIARRCLATLKE